MPEPTDPNATAARNLSASTPSAASDRDETAAGKSAAAAPFTSGFGPPAAPGEVGTLGPYRIVKELGKGGMGAVYAALDTRLERRVALKVMLPEFAADHNAKERFLREARAAAKISHDNVVTVYEADERDGVPYIAMLFLQGLPLDQYLKDKGAPPLAHVIRIGREAALGLAAAHELGLVHRDIKPANLWLEAPNGRVKVLDFGLAKPVGTDAELTKSGAVMGTPAYMSPEQARGLKVDHRTDLFGLGAVLYRLCTGKNPFIGEHVMAVLAALIADDPTPVRELNPAVPESLARLIHQLLAKKPEQRPQTANDVAKRLRAILDRTLAPVAPAPSHSAPAVGATELSASQPVVVNPIPHQPPVAVPMHVTAQSESVFADLDVADEGDATRAESADGIVPKRSGGRGIPIAVGGAVVLAAIVAAVVVSQTGKKGAPEAKEATPAPGDKGAPPRPAPKVEPAPWKPGSEGKPLPAGQSPFDKLDPNEIPKEERFGWQPKELVAVVGAHARRHWDGVPYLSVALTADGRLAATRCGGRIKELVIWDATTGTAKWRLPTTGDDGTLHFTPDGRRLFNQIGSELVAYDLTGPKPVETRHRLTGSPDGKAAVEWQGGELIEDGRTLGVGVDGRFALFDVSNGAPRLTETKNRARGSFAIVADSAVVYVAPDGKLRRARVKGARITTDEELPVRATGQVQPLGVSPDGTRVVVWGDAEARIWDVGQSPPKLAFQIREHVSADALYTFSADRRWLVVKHTHTALFRIDGQRPEFVGWLDQTARGWGGRCVLSRSGDRAVVGNSEGFVRFWDLSGAMPRESPPFDPATAFAGMASPAGARGGKLVLPRLDRFNDLFRYQVWDLTGPVPTPAPVTNPSAGRACSVEILTDGRLLEHGTGEAFRLFETIGDRWKAACAPFGHADWSAAPTGRPLAVGVSANGPPARMDGWNLAAAPPERAWTVELPDLDASAANLFFASADGRAIATPRRAKGNSRELVLWRSAGAKVEVYATLPVTCDPAVYRGCLSPDGYFLAHAHSGTLSVWDLTGKAPRVAQSFATQGALSIAFHPGGQKLVTAGFDGVRLTDVASGQVVWKWDSPGPVDRAEFAHDGRHLFLHNGNKTVYVVRLMNLSGEVAGANDRKAAE